MEDLFKQAAIGKFRFESSHGELTVEDLFDVPLEPKKNDDDFHLEAIAIAVNEELKAVSGSESFVKKSKKDSEAKTILTAKLDIVKAVIEYKESAKEASEKRAEKAAKKKELLEIYKEAQTQSLRTKSPEEILAMIEALD